jgi:HAMP domain-containing protein
MSLRTKLLILSVILALIPLGISGQSMIRITRDELMSAAQENLSTVANQITQDIEDDFYYTWLAPLQLISKAVESENLGAQEKLSLLTEGVISIPDVASLQISVAGDFAPLIVIENDFFNRLKKIYSDPEQALALTPEQISVMRLREDIFVGELTYLKEPDIWLITILLPLNEVTFGRPASLCARINLERIKKRIENHPFAKNGTSDLTLIDARGRKIFDPERPDISSYELVKIAKKLLPARQPSVSVKVYTRPSGERMLGACSFPRAPDVAIIVEQDEAKAYQAVADMKSKLLMWVIAGLSFAVAGAVVLSVSLTRPLHRLTRAARLISEGDLSVKIEYGGRKGEIAELSGAFNKMVGDLRGYIHQLTETTKAKERAEKELELARDIQQSFLPKTFPKLQEMDVWGTCEPAREVGGDYFDFFQLDDDHYGMVIGDVSGKGAPAALFMAVSRTLFRTLSSRDYLPSRVLTDFNDRLVELDEGANMFITLFYGVLNIRTGQLLYSTAGHNMPYVKSSDEGFRILPKMKTMIAGMMDGMEMEGAALTLLSGDIIVLYTDGMTEAINENDEEFGEARLEELLDTYAGLSAKEMCGKLIEDVKTFQSGRPQFDDMTLFILKFKGGSSQL